MSIAKGIQLRELNTQARLNGAARALLEDFSDQHIRYQVQDNTDGDVTEEVDQDRMHRGVEGEGSNETLCCVGSDVFVVWSYRG